MTELEYLRGLYLDELGCEVDYGKGARTRVAYPGKWARYDSVINIKSKQKILTPDLLNNTWVWSDQHFFHKNVIDFSERPFNNLNTMHTQMRYNYNNIVKPDDICIWVGDVGFGSTSQINELLARFNGYKILIIGNHDYNGKKLRNLDFDETHLLYHLDIPHANLVFTHYPMHNIIPPWFNIHGHLHNYPTPDTGNILHQNVNCEVQDYQPIPITKLIKIAKMRLIAKGM